MEEVVWPGRILVAAGALDRDVLDRVATDLDTALTVRSRPLLDRHGRRHFTIFTPPDRPPPRPGRQPLPVSPIGRALRVDDERAPWTLHLLSLVRTRTEALITVAMRMHWPPDGSSTDLEITGAGPHHMPYDQLWAQDDGGTSYAVRFESGPAGTGAWLGLARLSPVPPAGARRLDLIGDGTRLIQLPIQPLKPSKPFFNERLGLTPPERLLATEAERILATGDAIGPRGGPIPGEIITVLADAGAIAPGSPVPGQLAAVCQRLDAPGHGITVPPAGQLPPPWASVIAHRDAPPPGPEVFTPLAVTFPDVDGATFALAGLTTATGQSYLHVIASGLPPPAGRFTPGWTPGWSWWVRDVAGNWHVALAGGPDELGDGLQALWLRLTPALTTDPAEIVVTGPATRVSCLVAR